MEIPCADAPAPLIDGEHPPNPNRREKSPYDISISLKPTNAQGSQQLCGGETKGEAPPYRGMFKGSVPHVRDPLQPLQHAKASENIQMHRGAWGTYGGVYMPGAYKHMGAYDCMGHTNVGGIQTPPSIKNMPTSKKSRKKPYLKLNSYT